MDFVNTLLSILTVVFMAWAGILYRTIRHIEQRVIELEKEIAVLNERLDSLCARFERRRWPR